MFWPPINADNTTLDALTNTVLRAVFEVSNTLGAGFLERVYQRPLLRELRLRGLSATAEAAFSVMYKGQAVGEYFADILVEDAVVVELKCAERLSTEHSAQCLNYLRAFSQDGVSARKLSEDQGGMEANRARLFGYR